MRHFYLAAVLGAFALGLPCMPAFASGNVLVPSDGGAPGTSNNSGAAPAQSSPGETVLPAIDSSDTPSQDILNPSTSAFTPMPFSSLSLTSSSDEATLAHIRALAAGELPTMVFRVPATVPPNYSLADIPPYNLNMSIQDYAWGPDDISNITNKLHIPADQVAKHCNLAFAGMLTTDAGIYNFDTSSSSLPTILRYAGKPSSIDGQVRASCDLVPLPPNSGIIFQVGNRYVLFIALFKCDPPPPNSDNLVFSYAGNGNAQCVYQ